MSERASQPATQSARECKADERPWRDRGGAIAKYYDDDDDDDDDGLLWGVGRVRDEFHASFFADHFHRPVR